MIALTRDIGDSLLSLTSTTRGVVNISSFYVRPAGTIYGTGDGTSYENAWSGFGNIEWGQLGSHTRLYICGTHNELLDVGASNTIIQGDYPEDPGIIDHTGSSGIRITSRDNITLNNITSLNALVNGLLIEGTSSNIVTNNCEFSNTGNQGIQHLNSSSATHNNVTCKNNLDDGISGHDDSVIVVNGGVFENNAEGVAIVNSVKLTINGDPIFLNNTDYDLYANASSGPEAEACEIEAHYCTITGNVHCTSGAIITLYNCKVEGDLINISTINIYDSIINRVDYRLNVVDNIANFYRCVILSSTNIRGTVLYDSCRIFESARVDGKLETRHTLYDGIDKSTHILDVTSGGELSANYCIFKNIPASTYGIAVRSGSIKSTINNCNFVGVSQIGRGTFSQVDIEINNCIYTGLEIGHNRSAGDSILNNCCLFDCNTPTSGIVTNNNPVTGNPLFADLSNEDYSLSEGSPCIDAGLDTGFPEGVDTANWGDSENTPVVSTKLQGENYDIGAYVK